jgi:hypothetical protein
LTQCWQLAEARAPQLILSKVEEQKTFVLFVLLLFKKGLMF